jgi:hypothetical protein
VGTRHHGTTSWSGRSYSRCYKPIILNTQEVCSGSKGSTTPAAQAQSK